MSKIPIQFPNIVCKRSLTRLPQPTHCVRQMFIDIVYTLSILPSHSICIYNVTTLRHISPHQHTLIPTSGPNFNPTIMTEISRETLQAQLKTLSALLVEAQKNAGDIHHAVNVLNGLIQAVNSVGAPVAPILQSQADRDTERRDVADRVVKEIDRKIYEIERVLRMMGWVEDE